MLKKILLLIVIVVSNLSWTQTDFLKYSTNPVLERTKVFGEWDAIAASDPHVLYHNDTLKMWYTGVGWLSVSDTSVHQRIGYAWSLNGIDWTQYDSNPVLDKTDGDWDDLGVETCTVLIDSSAIPSERYKMWYAGQSSATGIYDIGYAYSADGLNWSKSSSNPVLQIGVPSSWENGFLEGPSVLLVEDTLRMWYASIDLVGDGSPTDFSGNIGYAWSLDGVNWNKHPSNPIFRSYDSPTWDQASAADPHVIYKDGEYQMWYAGLNSWSEENFKMGYASSTDGINWTRPVSSPVLETGEAGEWDREDASYGCVIYHPTEFNYQMWYTGLDTNSLPADLDGYFYEIGYATTPSSLEVLSDEQQSVLLYPNPNKGRLFIAFDNGLLPEKVIVTNLIGEVVPVTTSFSNGRMEIDVHSLPNARYICVLYFSDAEHPIVKSFVKN